MLDCEMRVLGSYLLYKGEYDTYCYIKPDDFSTLEGKKAYSVMRYLRHQKKNIDLVGFVTTCEGYYKLDEIGGISAPMDWLESVPPCYDPLIDIYKMLNLKGMRDRKAENGDND